MNLAPCQPQKIGSGYDVNMADNNSMTVKLKDNTAVTIQFTLLTATGSADTADGACANARAELFTNGSVESLIDTLDAIQTDRISGLPGSDSLCATTFMRIYDTADLSKLTTYNYSTEHNVAPCPK
jgi:hypothetical protein